MRINAILFILFLVLLVKLETSFPKTIKVGAYPNAPQFVIDKSANLSGIAPDIITYIAKKNGFNVEYVIGDWSSSYSNLLHGKIDILPVIGSNSKRNEIFDFSRKKILLNWGVVYQRPDSETYDIFRLKGKRIALLRKGLVTKNFLELMDRFEVQANYVYVTNLVEALYALDRGDVDVAVVNRTLGEHYEGKLYIEKTPIVFGSFASRFAVPKGKNADLLKTIDDELERLKSIDSSEYYDILEKWLGYKSGKELPKFLLVAFAIVLIIALFLMLNSFWLKRIADERSKDLIEKNEYLKREIKARMQAEKLLKETGRTASVGGWELDIESGRLFWTEEIYNICEIDPSVTPDLELAFSVYEEAGQNALEKAVKKAISEKGEYDLELPIRTTSGKRLYVRAIGKTEVKDGEVFRLSGSFQDITEIYLMRKELKRREAMYLSLVENIPNGAVHLINKDMVYLYSGGQILKEIGIGKEDLDNKNIFEVYDESTSSFLEKHYKKAFEGHDEEFEFPFASRVFEVRAVPLYSDNKINNILVLSQDISSRKKNEERLKDANRKLEEANRDLRDFAYIVSHDLRSPLVNIKGFSDELSYSLESMSSICSSCSNPINADKREITKILSDEIPQSLTYIRSSITKMDNLISSVLTLSRLGKKDLVYETLDMNEIAKSAKEQLEYLIKESKSVMEIEKLPMLEADRSSMELVMQNLLANSVKYLRENVPGEIKVKSDSDEFFHYFHIEDNGRGIRKDDIPKAFQIFRRVGRQTVEGSGMGLSYVNAVIKRHGGEIWCESEEGRKSVFSFKIPKRRNKGK